MNEFVLCDGPALHGLRTVVIENSLLRIVVLPEAGAKIWQITYKPLHAELLWNSPTVAPAGQALNACYDDVWSGGWDELFPTDEPFTFMGKLLPDHGELWTGEWQAKPIDGGVHLAFTTPVSHFLVEKTLLLRVESSTLEIGYRLTNKGDERFPFMFKLHPAFAVSPEHRIDFPPMRVTMEPEFRGTLSEAPEVFRWPYAPMGDRMLDLRQVPDVSSRALRFFYGDELEAGWCGVTNRSNRLAAALRFDAAVFPSCWLFASHGGWQNVNAAVLEPATGYPFKMQPMIDAGRARWLGAGESLETAVLFCVQEGLTSIGGVEEDGRILAGEE